MFVIGITGSFGKTTTKQLLTHVLSRKDEVFTTPGSVNTALGIARSLLQNLGNAKTLIIEYAAYCPGEIARLAAVIRPDMAILTGLGTQHIELFGSQQAIAEAKAELLAALPINAPVFCSNQSALAVTAAYTGKKPLRIIKTWSDESVQITTKIIGKHYTQTILTVMAVAQFLGLSQKHIVEKLQTFVPTEKWIRKRVGRSGAQVLDDGGTSNPDGFSAALSLLAEYELPRKILATAGIIDLGTEAAAIHTRLAKEATVDVSEVWYLGEVGKHEFLQAFGEKLITDRELIVEKIQALDAETILLLEGRLPMWLTELL